MPGRSPWSLPHAAGSQLVTNSPASLGCCPLPGGSISWPTQYGLLSGLFASSKLAPGSTWGAHQPQLSPVPPPAAGKVSPPGAGSDTPLWASSSLPATSGLAPARLLRPQTGLILELLPVGNQAYCFTFPQITRALLHATMLVQAGHLSPGDDSSFPVSVPTSAPCTVPFIALGKISLNLSQTLSPAPGLSRLPVPYPSGLQTHSLPLYAPAASPAHSCLRAFALGSLPSAWDT